MARVIGLSDTQVKRRSASSSQSQSDDISAKSSTRASLARSAPAVAASLSFCSALRRNCMPITPNSTAKPTDTPVPPAAIAVAWLRHLASATGSSIETSMTSGQVCSGCTDTTARPVPRNPGER